jgi:hypothetical protein
MAWILDGRIDLYRIGTANLFFFPAMVEDLIDFGIAEDDAVAYAHFIKQEYVSGSRPATLTSDHVVRVQQKGGL